MEYQSTAKKKKKPPQTLIPNLEKVESIENSNPIYLARFMVIEAPFSIVNLNK